MVATPMTLSQIQGLLDLGMFSDAIRALDRLPADDQHASAALRIRSRASSAMGDWEKAKAAADILRHGNDLDRGEAACCFQSLAAEHFKFGRLPEAFELLRRAIGTRPQQRALILEDLRFTEKFLEPLAPRRDEDKTEG